VQYVPQTFVPPITLHDVNRPKDHSVNFVRRFLIKKIASRDREINTWALLIIYLKFHRDFHLTVSEIIFQTNRFRARLSHHPSITRLFQNFTYQEPHRNSRIPPHRHLKNFYETAIYNVAWHAAVTSLCVSIWFYSPMDPGCFSRFSIYTQSVELLGRGISPSQGRYLHTEQHKHRINEHGYPCLEWDSNPRPQS
jgi:hypothetical protein